MASLNPDLSELDVEKIKQNEDRFGEKQAESKNMLTSRRFASVRNHRDKYLAHSLTSTNREKRSGPMPPPKYDHARELFEASIPTLRSYIAGLPGTALK
jgi:hypothetical protein